MEAAEALVTPPMELGLAADEALGLEAAAPLGREDETPPSDVCRAAARATEGAGAATTGLFCAAWIRERAAGGSGSTSSMSPHPSPSSFASTSGSSSAVARELVVELKLDCPKPLLGESAGCSSCASQPKSAKAGKYQRGACLPK